MLCINGLSCSFFVLRLSTVNGKKSVAYCVSLFITAYEKRSLIFFKEPILVFRVLFECMKNKKQTVCDSVFRLFLF